MQCALYRLKITYIKLEFATRRLIDLKFAAYGNQAYIYLSCIHDLCRICDLIRLKTCFMPLKYQNIRNHVSKCKFEFMAVMKMVSNREASKTQIRKAFLIFHFFSFLESGNWVPLIPQFSCYQGLIQYPFFWQEYSKDGSTNLIRWSLVPYFRCYFVIF